MSSDLTARPSPGGDPAPIAELIAGGTLDAELAARLWVLLDGGLPLVVASTSATAGERLAAALAELSVVAAPAQLVVADSLEGVLATFSGSPTGPIPDPARGLGLVVVVRELARARERVMAAHYIRPVERDAAGHLQRRPPALLAAHDQASDQLEHFAWAIGPELAERIGSGVADYERAIGEREGFLSALCAAGRSPKAAPN